MRCLTNGSRSFNIWSLIAGMQRCWTSTISPPFPQFLNLMWMICSDTKQCSWLQLKPTKTTINTIICSGSTRCHADKALSKKGLTVLHINLSQLPVYRSYRRNINVDFQLANHASVGKINLQSPNKPPN